jgi:gentisate 1,2-dioxygenase
MQTSDALQAYREELARHSVNFPGIDKGQIIRPKLHPVQPYHWNWDDLERLLTQSVEFQSTLPQGREGAERRIIRLQNPGIPEETVTDTMSVSVQYLLPGEVARTHRHTPNAFRFYLRGSAYTTVSGEKCEMGPGDLVITPFMEWHDHGNEGDEPAVWMDGLDYPLVRYLNAVVYEYADETRQAIDRTGISDRRYGSVGLRPGWEDTEIPVARRSLLRYRWETTWKCLESMAAAGDVSPTDDVLLEFVNPATGGSVFPTIACCVQLIRPGIETARHRHTGGAVYHAFQGSGVTVVGDERYEWSRGDFFVVPAMHWHQHANASSEPAVMFSIQDFPTLKALGLYREERG